MSERWGDSKRDRDALDRYLTTEPGWRVSEEGPHRLSTCDDQCLGECWDERSGTMGPDNDPVFEPLVITNRATMHTPDGKIGHGTIVTTIKPDGTVSYAWQPDPEQ